MNTIAANTIAASSPSLREMMIVAFRYKRSILAASVLPVLLALAMAYSQQKIYEADSKILVRAGREYVAALETGEHNAIAPSGTMQEAIDTEVEILTSRDVLNEVVEAIGVERLYPPMPPSWFVRLLPRFDPEPEAGGGSAGDRARNMAVKALSDDLRVKPIKLSNVIELSVRNPDPAMTAEVLDKLLAVFRVHHIAAFNRQRSGALEEQLTRHLGEIGGLERERSQYANANRLFAAGEQRTALIQQRAASERELQETSVRRAALEEQVRTLAAQIQRQPRTVRLETQTQPSTATAETEKSLQALRAKEGLYAAHFRADSAMLRDLRVAIAAHEQVLAKGTDVSAIRTGINPVLTTLETQSLTARTELAPLAGKEADLAVAIAATDARLRDLGTAELKVMELDRRIAQLGAATTTLNQRLNDARFLDDLDRQRLTSVNVIENAVAPEKPVYPRKALFGIAGIAVGLAAGFGAFLLALTFRNRFLSVEMTERVLGIQVVAAMPLMPRRRERPTTPETTPSLFNPRRARVAT